MPMPMPGTAWPLAEYAPALEAIRADDAVLTGDLKTINNAVADEPRPYQHRSQLNGGVVGAASRAVLGKPMGRVSKNHIITHHLPIADELVTALADYMAGKPPQATLHPDDEDNEQAAEALASLVESDVFAADWWKAVHRAGALGWCYGRVVWNQAVQPHPWIEWIDPDSGMVEFENGRPVAALFWDTWKHDKNTYRLLQRHTPGQIEYQLFEGKEDNLGRAVPFDSIPETNYLVGLEGLQDGTILPTGATRSTASILLNYRGRQEWRTHPLLRHYSVSDTSRGLDIFHTIDRNWSQLQHEVDAARGRLFVDEMLLESAGPGQGAYLDWWRDIYPTAPGGDADGKPTFEQVQFNMRVEQYLQLIDSGIRKAVSALGLSPFTVDMDPQASGDMTATETKARTKRTRATAETKGRMERAHLSELLTAWLEMDADLNGYASPTRPVVVALPDQIEVSERETIESVASLRSVDGISIPAMVRKLHPEWTADEVDVEIAELRRERQGAVDPFNTQADTPPVFDEQ